MLNIPIKTFKEVELEHAGKEISLANSVITNIELNVIAHFNNTVSISVNGPNFSLFRQYNLGLYIQDIIKAIVECLQLEEEGGLNILELKDVPIRLVLDENCIVIGFGHFMKDLFILTKDVVDAARLKSGELNDALDKEKPRLIRQIDTEHYVCPACESVNICFDSKVDNKYCPECGQRIRQGEKVTVQ